MIHISNHDAVSQELQLSYEKAIQRFSPKADEIDGIKNVFHLANEVHMSIKELEACVGSMDVRWVSNAAKKFISLSNEFASLKEHHIGLFTWRDTPLSWRGSRAENIVRAIEFEAEIYRLYFESFLLRNDPEEQALSTLKLRIQKRATKEDGAESVVVGAKSTEKPRLVDVLSQLAANWVLFECGLENGSEASGLARGEAATHHALFLKALEFCRGLLKIEENDLFNATLVGFDPKRLQREQVPSERRMSELTMMLAKVNREVWKLEPWAIPLPRRLRAAKQIETDKLNSFIAKSLKHVGMESDQSGQTQKNIPQPSEVSDFYRLQKLKSWQGKPKAEIHREIARRNAKKNKRTLTEAELKREAARIKKAIRDYEQKVKKQQ